jgi:elongation factor G
VASLLTHRFHRNPLTIALPIASFNPADYIHGEPGVQGIVDLVKWEIWKYGKDVEPTRFSLPRNSQELLDSPLFPTNHPIIPHLIPARTAMLEKLSMFSEELMDTLLSSSDTESYLQVDDKQIMRHLRDATLQNDVLPVLCGSAIKSIGTNLVLDYIGELFASPVDVLGRTPSPNEPFRALAWKVTWDSKRGWMTFVRVYSGI